MVTSLFEICLLCWRNAVESDDDHHRIGYVDLPLTLRRSLFDCVRKHRQLNNSNCIRMFDEWRFFEDFNRIDLLPSETAVFSNHRYFAEPQFLGCLLTSVRSQPQLTETITSLSFCLHYEFEMLGVGTTSDTDASNLRSIRPMIWTVCEVLRHCRRLDRLSLTVVHKQQIDPVRFPILDRLSDSLAENQPLIALELRNFYCDCLRRTETNRLFGALQRLAIENVKLNSAGWLGILGRSQATLRSLTLNCFSLVNGARPAFPVELPTLIRLDVQNCVVNIAQIAARCPSLIEGSLEINCESIFDSDLSAIDQLANELRFTVCLTGRSISPNFLRFIDLFGVRIDKFVVDTRSSIFVDEIADAVLSGCPNLIGLELLVRIRKDPSPMVCDRFLRAFLTDRRRASALRELKLDCVLEKPTVDMLFRNCSNLDKLHFGIDFDRDPDLITDQSLLIWMKTGARPSVVDVFPNNNLTTEGVISILKHCRSKLRQVRLYPKSESFSPSPVLDAILLHCRHLEKVGLPNMSTVLEERQAEINRNMFFSADIFI